jgi:hypothetical protein
VHWLENRFESARAELGNVAPGRLGGRDGRICSLGSGRRKRACRVNSQAEFAEAKKKMRKLRHSSNLELEVDSAPPNPGDDAADADLVDDVESWGGVRANRYVTEEEEDDGDEKDMPSLVCRDHRSKASSDIPDLTLSKAG